ncbi:hypothetical protein ACSBR2_032390 [Camellia fascicularis]
MYLDQRLKDDTDYGNNLFKPHSTVCMNWLNAKPSGSVVYASFGSMAEVEPEQIEEIAWGLNQSNYNFFQATNNFINDTAQKGLVFVADVWGLGIRAKLDDKGIVRREVLEACMKEVIEGEKKNEVKMNAMKWKKLAKEAVGEGWSSDKNINEFVAKLA